MKKKNSLKFKFFGLSLILGLILVLLIAFFAQFRIKNTIEEFELNKLNYNLKHHTHEINKRFSNFKLLSQMIADKYEVENFLTQGEISQKELRDLFLKYQKTDDDILSIYLLNKEGTTLVSSDRTFEGNNYGFRNYFKFASNGNFYLDTAIGKTSNEFGFYFSYPVKDDESQEILGVLTLKSSDKYINELLNNSQLNLNGRVLLSDENGVVLISSYEDFVLKSLWPLEAEEIKRIKDSQRFLDREISSLPYAQIKPLIYNYGQDEILEIERYDDEHKLKLLVEKIKDEPFYLLASVDMTEINKQIYLDLLPPLSIAIIIVFLISLLFYLATIKFFAKPIEALVIFSKEIASGNFENKIKVKKDDEIGSLSKAMNKMTDKLNNYYSDLRKEVNIKTKEIDKKNKDLEDQKLAVLNILEDVDNEKNRAEALVKDLKKFKLALDNASDHIIITDSEGIILYANKAVEKITGYSLKKVLGTKAGELWKLPMPNKFYKKLWKKIKDDKEVFKGEIRNKRKNGEEYDALISISPILDRENKVEFFVGIERDITKEKEIDRAKTEFVSLASHQLRTPLSSINWYAEMLLDGDAGKLKSEQKEFISEMYKSNQRMVDLVNSLLNVSRIELGTFAVEPEKIDVIKVAEEVISELKSKINNKEMNMEFNFDKIPKILADPKLVRIIFQNLLSNAIKYTPEKGDVSLSVKKDKKNVLIKVKDSGYGIPKKNHDKIFSKLFRADNIKTRDTEGTGLGLYIIKSIVDHTGGEITFESEENKGTEFSVKLPLSGMKKKDGSRKIE